LKLGRSVKFSLFFILTVALIPASFLHVSDDGVSEYGYPTVAFGALEVVGQVVHRGESFEDIYVGDGKIERTFGKTKFLLDSDGNYKAYLTSQNATHINLDSNVTPLSHNKSDGTRTIYEKGTLIKDGPDVFIAKEYWNLIAKSGAKPWSLYDGLLDLDHDYTTQPSNDGKELTNNRYHDKAQFIETLTLNDDGSLSKPYLQIINNGPAVAEVPEETTWNGTHNVVTVEYVAPVAKGFENIKVAFANVWETVWFKSLNYNGTQITGANVANFFPIGQQVIISKADLGNQKEIIFESKGGSTFLYDITLGETDFEYLAVTRNANNSADVVWIFGKPVNLELGQTIDLDPVQGFTTSSTGRTVTGNNVTADCADVTSWSSDTAGTPKMQRPNTSGSDNCQVVYIDFDLSGGIPAGTVVDSALIDYQITSNAGTPPDCEWRQVTTAPPTGDNTFYTEYFAGTVVATDDSGCNTTGDDKTIAMNSAGLTSIQTILDASGDFYVGVFFKDSVRDGTQRDVTMANNDATLKVTYVTPKAPDSTIMQSTSTNATGAIFNWFAPTNLDTTAQPAINGYQIGNHSQAIVNTPLPAHNGTAETSLNSTYFGAISTATADIIQLNDFDSIATTPSTFDTTGLVTYLQCEELVGGTTIENVSPSGDSAGTSGDGVITNDVSIGTGIVGSGSCVLDGTNDKITIGDTLSTFDEPLSSTAQFTVSWWMKPDNVANNDVVLDQANTSSSNKGLMLKGEVGNKFTYQAYESGTALYISGVPTNAIDNGVWQLYTLTYDYSLGSANWIWYENGVELETDNKSNDGTDTTPSGQLTFGEAYAGNDGDYHGEMDEFMWFDRTLSASEVSDLYNGGAGLDLTGTANLISDYSGSGSDSGNQNNLIIHSGSDGLLAEYEPTVNLTNQHVGATVIPKRAMVLYTGSALIGLEVDRLDLYMQMTSALASCTVEAEVYDSDGSTQLLSFGTMSTSDISTDYTWYTFENTGSSLTLSDGDYITFDSNGCGTWADPVVRLYGTTNDDYDGALTQQRYHNNSVWVDQFLYEFAFKLYNNGITVSSELNDSLIHTNYNSSLELTGGTNLNGTAYIEGTDESELSVLVESLNSTSTTDVHILLAQDSTVGETLHQTTCESSAVRVNNVEIHNATYPTQLCTASLYPSQAITISDDGTDICTWINGTKIGCDASTDSFGTVSGAFHNSDISLAGVQTVRYGEIYIASGADVYDEDRIKNWGKRNEAIDIYVTNSTNTALSHEILLSPNTKWCEAVRPGSSVGFNGTWSNLLCAKIPLPPPNDVAGVASSDTQVQVTWTAPDNGTAVGYQILGKVSSADNYDVLVNDTGVVLSATVASLTASTIYNMTMNAWGTFAEIGEQSGNSTSFLVTTDATAGGDSPGGTGSSSGGTQSSGGDDTTDDSTLSIVSLFTDVNLIRFDSINDYTFDLEWTTGNDLEIIDIIPDLTNAPGWDLVPQEFGPGIFLIGTEGATAENPSKGKIKYTVASPKKECESATTTPGCVNPGLFTIPVQVVALDGTTEIRKTVELKFDLTGEFEFGLIVIGIVGAIVLTSGIAHTIHKRGKHSSSGGKSTGKKKAVKHAINHKSARKG
jgi:hypothetical protein